MATRVYAVAADLANWLKTDAPENATALLRSASIKIADLIKMDIYETDEDGHPTDVDLVSALKDATCAQAAWYIETGDDQGISEGFQSLSLGSFSGTHQLGVSPLVAPQTLSILQQAGLASTAPASRMGAVEW